MFMGRLKYIAPGALTLVLGACALFPFRAGEDAGGKSARKLEKKLHYTRTYKPVSPQSPGDAKARDPRFAYVPGRVSPAPRRFIVRDKKGPPRILGEYVVQLKPGRVDLNLLRELKAEGIEAALIGYIPSFRMVQVHVARDDEKTLERLRDLPSVKSAFRHHVHGRRQTFSRETRFTWHILDYDLPRIWKITRGKGVRIAILDSGMALKLAAFRGRIRHPYSVFTGSARFLDGEIREGTAKFRILDHGTAVAAVAAGYRGIAAEIGTAPQAEIMPIQVIGGKGADGGIRTSDMMILEGIARALAYRARVINISLGTDYAGVFPPAGPNYRERLRRFYRGTARYAASARGVYDFAFAECKRLGVPVVVAAGNDDMPVSSQPIASHPYTIAVGAVDSDGFPAMFTNRGREVDAHAPGAGVLSISSQGRDYWHFGTSFSAPYISGLLALALARKPKLTPARLKAALREAHVPVRLSIIPGRPVRILDPIRFCHSLGIFVLEFSTLPDRMRKMANEYKEKNSDLFVQPADDERAILRKIVKLGRRRLKEKHKGPFFIIPPMERRYIRETAPEFPDFLVELIVKEKNESVALSVASVFGLGRLSPRQLDKVGASLGRSDVLCHALLSAKYRPALPRMYALIRSRDMNHYRLHCAYYLDPVGARKPLLRYAERIRRKYPRYRFDEALVVFLLTRRTRHRVTDQAEVRRLLANSLKRFRALKFRPGGYVPGDSRKWAYFTSLEILMDNRRSMEHRRSLALLLDGIELLDDSISAKRQPASLHWWRNRYIYLLNLRLGAKLQLDRKASVETRRKAMGRLRKLLPRLVRRKHRWSLPVDAASGARGGGK